ncbi:MAG: hypothetical protein ACREMJ_11010, partial [Gemmatimonadales bacterium]
MTNVEIAVPPARCAQCGTELGPSLLACPFCGRLVHTDELKRLAGHAEAAVGAGDPGSALAAWREALALLPATARQHRIVAERVAALAREVGAAGGAPEAARD